MKQYKFSDIESVQHVKITHNFDSLELAENHAKKIISDYEQEKILSAFNKNPLIIFYNKMFFNLVLIKMVSYDTPNQSILVTDFISPFFEGQELEVQEEAYKSGAKPRIKRSIATVIEKVVETKGDLANLKFRAAYACPRVIFEYSERILMKKGTRIFKEQNPLWSFNGAIQNQGIKTKSSNEELNLTNDFYNLALNLAKLFPEKAHEIVKNTDLAKQSAFREILEEQLVKSNKDNKDNIDGADLKSINKLENGVNLN